MLSGVLAQRLVRRICQACRAPDHPDPAISARPRRDRRGAASSSSAARAATTAAARAIAGRIGIYELFRITEDARSLILRKAPAGEIRRHAVAQGMVTLREDGWAKALRGAHHGGGDPARDAGGLA